MINQGLVLEEKMVNFNFWIKALIIALLLASSCKSKDRHDDEVLLEITNASNDIYKEESTDLLMFFKQKIEEQPVKFKSTSEIIQEIDTELVKYNSIKTFKKKENLYW